MKKFVSFVLITVLSILYMLNLTGCAVEHIPDTNGDEDFTLGTITDENIVNRDMGAINVNETWDNITNTTSYNSKCFSGVYEVYYENIITNRYEITVNHARVDKGNFKMVLCINGEIVHTFKLNELSQTFVMENVKGTVSLIIAGESAEFMFDYYTL